MDFGKLSRHSTWLVLAALSCAAAAAFLSGCEARGGQPSGQAIYPQAAPAVSVNINTAAAAELEQIPHIGPALAERIVEHRMRYGPFRKVENLIVIDGISDARFRKIRHLVRVE